MVNAKNRDWSEADIFLGGVRLNEILSQLVEWVENSAQEIPFKDGESETFHREWDFQIAGRPAHFKIEAKISSQGANLH